MSPVLVVDVGGSHVKVLATDQPEPLRADSGPDLTAAQNLAAKTFSGGGGASNIAPMGAIKVDVTSNGNTADAGPDVLTTYSLPASTLNAAGRTLHIHAWGVMAANGNTKTVVIAPMLAHKCEIGRGESE